jgi:hypothetical protein
VRVCARTRYIHNMQPMGVVDGQRSEGELLR